MPFVVNTDISAFTNCNSGICQFGKCNNKYSNLVEVSTYWKFLFFLSCRDGWMHLLLGYRIDSERSSPRHTMYIYKYTRTLHHIRAIITDTSAHSLWFSEIKCHCLTTTFTWFLDFVHGKNLRQVYSIKILVIMWKFLDYCCFYYFLPPSHCSPDFIRMQLVNVF